MNTTLSMYGWNQIPWRKLERSVFKLQKQIYQASQRDDVKTVHRLQRLLLKSWSAKCLAIRQVTQDNQGKRTAGIDGVKDLSSKARLKLIEELDIERKPRPIRRVWIPKPGKDEKRPLGIPVMHDRAAQALVKMALEPEWEAKFEPNSYGFRPGRSAHDAVRAIFDFTKLLPKYVLDADIAKCFDNINHQVLLDKLNTLPTIRKVIKGWLKAGIMEGGKTIPATRGTPQGGVISPLLANIALHGMENLVKSHFPIRQPRINGKTRYISSPALIRYADNFVIIHTDLEVIQQCQKLVEAFLGNLGLELSLSKTSITHTLTPYNGKLGFDFLGFNVRQYPVGKNHSGINNGKKIGFKVLIKPSKKSIKSHYQKLSDVIAKHKGYAQQTVIDALNPAIRGWCNYFDACVSKRTFSYLDTLLFRRLKRWAFYRHPNKSWQWTSRKYWKRVKNDNWVFATPKYADEQWILKKHRSTPIRRHVKVQGSRSPYDGDWLYWGVRLSKSRVITKEKRRLLIKQKSICSWCGLHFTSKDVIETDHIIPLAKGGKDVFDNKQLLHRHCHDTKTALDLFKRTGRSVNP